MWLLIAFIILILFNFAFKTTTKNHPTQTVKDEQILRHTINVNLNILDSEIIELTALIANNTKQRTATTEEEEAKALLQLAQTTASSTRLVVAESGYDELQGMLGQVFGAMNMATSARRLLNACRPL